MSEFPGRFEPSQICLLARLVANAGLLAFFRIEGSEVPGRGLCVPNAYYASIAWWSSGYFFRAPGVGDPVVIEKGVVCGYFLWWFESSDLGSSESEELS